MAKSRAEIQRAYRQRQKEKHNEEYLRKERERMRRSYVPSSELSERERSKRNDRIRKNLTNFYKRRREARQAGGLQDTSGYESASDQERLLVRMNFKSKSKGAILRWRRELSTARSRIRDLEDQKRKLVKKMKSTQRSLQRKKNSQHGPATPRKETENIMKKAKLTKHQAETLRKPILLGNVLCREVMSTKMETAKGKVNIIHRVIAGKILRKYRCSTFLSKKTGLCRHRLAKLKSKVLLNDTTTRVRTVRRYRATVEEFLKREDNSRLQPGKADSKKTESGDKRQVYVLTDYLPNLYQKFKAEYPDSDISLTSFTRCRPKYILTTSFSSRYSCLCTKHQNAALSVKTLRKQGVIIALNPERALEQLPDKETLLKDLEEVVVTSQWKRKEVEEKGKKKSVTKIVETSVPKATFVENFEAQMREFREHVNRVKRQYNELRQLKQSLPEHEMIVQLDFAENYSCRSCEEVQSAYFNQTNVTLHPLVAYFHAEEDRLAHQSFIVVSDELAHKSSTVISFIEEIMPALKEIDPDIQKIHYWSDSPTSQYRNKHVFDLVANHFEKFSVKAQWNYFEAGHGKGPCDGLGGTCKRLADEATRSGRAVIQDAESFFKWAERSSMTNVQFRFVSKTRCSESEKALERNPVKPIKGTMKLHAVFGLGNSKVYTRDVSCYCMSCLSGNVCDGWSLELTRKPSDASDNNGDLEMGQSTAVLEPASAEMTEPNNVDQLESSTDADDTEHTSVDSEVNERNYVVDDFVAAVYDGKWYVGQITDVDEDDFQISFMEPKRQLFQWPSSADELWINKTAVLCKVHSLNATGKSRRMFNLKNDEKQAISTLCDAYNARM